ncbi:hypothetical protein KIPB_016483, partial [Kipferlia bialata]|eukprot:g16483.t1
MCRLSDVSPCVPVTTSMARSALLAEEEAPTIGPHDTLEASQRALLQACLHLGTLYSLSLSLSHTHTHTHTYPISPLPLGMSAPGHPALSL